MIASQLLAPTLGDFLRLNGFDKEWSAPEDLSQKIFPKFLSRIGSHAFRLHNSVLGSGMLQYNGQWTKPDCDIRALAMGFPRDHLATPTISTTDRHRLIGSCIDGNITKWFVDALCASTTSPSELFMHNPCPPQPWTIYLDSGSSAHMWGDLTKFTDYTPHLGGPVWVGGIKFLSYGSGTVYMRLRTNTESIVSATLKNVL